MPATMVSVKLSETGRHLFDAPFCYEKEFTVDGLSISSAPGVLFVPRELSAEEQSKLFSEIERLNNAWEKDHDVNQPIDPS